MTGRYRTIVADPPWAYEGFTRCAPGTPRARRMERGTQTRVDMPYGAMTLASIAALPVASLADDSGCRLFLWTTNRYLPDAMQVVRAWDFTYRQTLVWWKTDALPFVTSVAPNSAEFILVCTIGSPARTAGFPSAVISHPASKQHSRKPELFMDLVEQVSPGPYVELFSRRHRLGWDVWGNESANTADWQIRDSGAAS